MSRIKAVVFDIDGVLTDGGVSVDGEGRERKVFCLPDLDFLFRMKREGLLMAAITGEDTPLARFVEGRFPWDRFLRGCKDKGPALEETAAALGITLGEVCYIGDGTYDVPALERAGLGVCPANAVREARRAARVRLSRRGGQGCVEELYWRLQEENRDPSPGVLAHLDRLMERYPALSGVREDILRGYRCMEAAYSRGGKLLIAGNGGSASDAEHVAAELMKRFVLPRPLEAGLTALLLEAGPRGAELARRLEAPLTAVSLMGHEALTTAFSNDVDGRLAAAQQLLGFGRPGDALLALSTSGNSENILLAAVLARALDIRVVALTGGSGGALAPLADAAVVVPEEGAHRIQELHLPIYHCWCLMLEERFFGQGAGVIPS